MEGLEEKIYQTQKSLDLAKAAYQDRFGLNPDEITGSPVKKVDFEYTQEYEKLRDQQTQLEVEDEKSPDTHEEQVVELNIQENSLGEEETEDDAKFGQVDIDLEEDLHNLLEPRKEEAQLNEANDNYYYVPIQGSTNYFKIDIDGLSQEHIDFFHSIKALLESQEVFKKFSQSGQLGSRPYDPLCGTVPEKKGFGKRIFALNWENLSQLTVRAPGSIHIEQYIELSDIIKMTIPGETMEVLKVKKVMEPTVLEKFKIPGQSLSVTAQQKRLIKGPEKREHVQKCLDCRWFTYSLICKESKFDFVQAGFLEFKYMSQGLENVIKNKKLAKKLAKRIELVEA